jgi:hypothetical protein
MAGRVIRIQAEPVTIQEASEVVKTFEDLEKKFRKIATTIKGNEKLQVAAVRILRREPRFVETVNALDAVARDPLPKRMRYQEHLTKPMMEKLIAFAEQRVKIEIIMRAHLTDQEMQHIYYFFFVVGPKTWLSAEEFGELAQESLQRINLIRPVGLFRLFVDDYEHAIFKDPEKLKLAAAFGNGFGWFVLGPDEDIPLLENECGIRYHQDLKVTLPFEVDARPDDLTLEQNWSTGAKAVSAVGDLDVELRPLFIASFGEQQLRITLPKQAGLISALPNERIPAVMRSRIPVGERRKYVDAGL